jgi:hypothetical protein
MSERGQSERLRRGRCAASAGWRWIYRLGSLRVAMILLFTVAAACAVATLCESRFNRQVAEAYIYHNPLFMLWLAGLGLNLLCSALTRWPWQRRHLGFVVTHGGIIILLAGAVAGHVGGVEASVNLTQGAPPVNRLVTNELVLMVKGPQSGNLYQTPLMVGVRQPTPQKPRVVAVPESGWQLELLDYQTAGTPLLLARLRGADGEPGRAEWLAAGTSRWLRAGTAAVQAGFGWRQVALPFGVALNDFSVPRDAGTNQPADFISDLTFTAADGEVTRARAAMNHPASFPGGWWRVATGLNYKFSPAGWDPENLGRTTLQVLYDPGWPGKWLGSLLVCGGMVLLFYCQPPVNTDQHGG